MKKFEDYFNLALDILGMISGLCVAVSGFFVSGFMSIPYLYCGLSTIFFIWHDIDEDFKSFFYAAFGCFWAFLKEKWALFIDFFRNSGSKQ